MAKLEEIKNCHVCGGSDLIPLLGVPVPDMMTDVEIIRNILLCNDCETVHYIDDGVISYEFSCKPNVLIGSKKSKKIYG